jgi:hypothetical protein
MWLTLLSLTMQQLELELEQEKSPNVGQATTPFSPHHTLPPLS